MRASERHASLPLGHGSVHKLRSSTKGGRDKLKRYAEARNRGEGVESKATWGDSKVSESITKCNIENADKKFLLDHWIARSGTPTFVSAPIGNNSMEVSSIEFHTVENTPQSMNFTKLDDSDINGRTIGKPMSKHKKLTICPPTELNIKLSALQNLESSIDELTSKRLNLQKRRGICSSDVLRDALESDMNNREFNKVLKNDQDSEISHETDGSNKKTSSDSIDMDLDLSFSDINSSDINTFNENIVQKLCLSALKNIKVGNQDADIENIQRIALDILKEMYVKKGKNRKCDTNILTTKREVDTPTEMLSVHDYENICAVNIAREAWGLRSWNGYCDIENWLHDDSVVRERRCDTFTSGSSEISSSTSQEIKNYVLSGFQGPLKKTPYYSNVCIKQEESNQQNDYVNTTERHSGDENIGNIKEIDTESELIFPISYVVDNVNNHLEPIIEELDDLGDMDPPTKKRLNSESSLVATIDEIRKATVTSSPKCVYHRREHSWDSPQLETTWAWLVQGLLLVEGSPFCVMSSFSAATVVSSTTARLCWLDTEHVVCTCG
ncbi:hypothetical protein EVAR_35481_1 [Eumeta japonica]|uniref:Uncharacterized protein n=1 Tax=Eumeta variegata TaxID=151549 RepID=A0A4C1XM17_EUMVA|nr:hypothetical protein EVAR_35481_1 [Eumeta japonica]